MSKLFDSKLLKKLDGLNLNTKVLSSTMNSGNRKSISKGSSVEFSDYREYTEGDDFRRIDWNAYAKFEKLFVKLFMEEREANINIFIDTSKSMDFGEPNKGFIAKRLAGSLGYIGMKNFDRVSINSISNKIESTKSNLKGKSSFNVLADFLENLEFKDETNILEGLKQLRGDLKKGISILISDLYTKGELNEIVKYLSYKKQEVYIFHILSPQEISPEIHDSLRLIDMESSTYVDVKITSSMLKSYDTNLNELLLDYEDQCVKNSAHYVHFSSLVEIENIISKVF